MPKRRDKTDLAGSAWGPARTGPPCKGCGLPMHPGCAEAGYTTHPLCDRDQAELWCRGCERAAAICTCPDGSQWWRQADSALETVAARLAAYLLAGVPEPNAVTRHRWPRHDDRDGRIECRNGDRCLVCGLPLHIAKRGGRPCPGRRLPAGAV